ncbi:probable disease resistance protein At1g61300 isoform X2 [Actinidia eriantha]|uniref:probable disease resistance protein At1g61300 isoform X2 n=1 Tax=Actinidia eriantha TaxID=165200 RepID=UPI00258CC6E6|nr:probable disease resistance protein At1g61300 isoform X2 [Actinidia eriantha]
MAGIATIGAVTGAVAATAGVVQAVSQAKPVFWDPFKVFLSENAEEICDALNESAQKLGSVRKDFENKVERNKMKVPTECYVGWIRRVMETDSQVTNLVAEFNKSKEEPAFWFPSCPDFSKKMKKRYKKILDLLQESDQIKDKILVDRSLEPVIKRKAPDIRKLGTLRKPLEKILNWLERYKVKAIGIHGILGIGKTTIMLNLNNHDQVAKKFDIVIWLTISKEGSKENLRREELQQAIMQRLKLKMEGASNADEVAQRISVELKDKKYLLLLDDVKEKLDLHEIGIPDCNNGSKVVLTTRFRHVCYDAKVNESIKVSHLSSREAWLMFQDVLGSKNLIEDPKIGPLAVKVCRYCSGLPLLIEKVANTFKLKNDEILWSDGLNSWRMWPEKECHGIKEMYKLLKFCYDDLPYDQYKKCFLYGALYPEDSNINIDFLLACWAAEDLLVNDSNMKKVHANGNNGIKQLGKDNKQFMRNGKLILGHLKDVSLLEEGKSDNHVTMHKFIRQVALYICEDDPECKYLVTTSRELKDLPDVEYWSEMKWISLVDNELDQLPDSPNCRMLSTLFLQKNLCIIPASFFENMRDLRVLDLSHTGITLLPRSLSTTLKVLCLNNCKDLADFPSYIKELVNLESLDIHGSGINYIPSHIEKLNLRRLWVSFGNENAAQDVRIKYDKISNLSSLEELIIELRSPQQWPDVVVENMIKEVAKLHGLKKLTICFPDKGVVIIEVAPILVNVPKTAMLLSFIERSVWEKVKRIGEFRFFIGCQKSEYCQNVKSAEYKKYVKYCNGEASDSPFLEVLAEANAYELVKHKDIRQLSDYGIPSMNKIQFCLIESCHAIETIVGMLPGVILPNLEHLYLKDLPMLESIWKGPLQLGSLNKLTTLDLTSCQILVNIFPSGTIQQLREIQFLKIENCPNVKEIIPESDAVANPRVLPELKELILFDMPKLSCVCAIESLEWASLEELKICKCPDLLKLPFNKVNAINLEVIEAEQVWWEALKWQKPQNNEVKERFHKFFAPSS